MKENIKTNKEMEKAHIFIVMEINMLENGKEEISMVQVFIITMIKVDMKEPMLMEKRKEKANIFVIMEMYMKEIM